MWLLMCLCWCNSDGVLVYYLLYVYFYIMKLRSFDALEQKFLVSSERLVCWGRLVIIDGVLAVFAEVAALSCGGGGNEWLAECRQVAW